MMSPKLYSGSFRKLSGNINLNILLPLRLTVTDFNLADLFLTGMVTYGPLALGIALFVGALGLLVPGTLFVLATGAFVRQG